MALLLRTSGFAVLVLATSQLIGCNSPKKEFETTVCNALDLSKADARRPSHRAKQAIHWLVDHVKTDPVKSAVGMLRYEGMDPAAFGGLLRLYNQEKIGADVSHCAFLDFLEKDVPTPGPVLSVDGQNLFVDDKPAGTLEEAEKAKAGGVPVQLGDLRTKLKFMEATWRSLHPDEPKFPGILVLELPPAMDDFDRRSIVFTANEAGWKDVRNATW